MTEESEESQESDKTYEDKHFESEEITFKERELDTGFPWKRLIFWGILTFVALTSGSQDVSFGIVENCSSLMFLAWIVGLIKPKAVFKFGLPNTRASVTQLYLCLLMSFSFLIKGDSTVWESTGALFVLLWFIGMINPRATFNFGFETRGEVTGLYILLGLLMGVIWGGLKGISFILA